MNEQRFERLHLVIDEQFDAISAEKRIDELRKQREKEQMDKLVGEWDYLMSPVLIAALRQAGSIISRVSASDVHIYTTLRPDYKYEHEKNHSFGDLSKRLHWNPQLSLIWDIKTKKIVGMNPAPVDWVEWNEITVSVRKGKTEESGGYVFGSTGEGFQSDSSEDSIYEALDRASSNPRKRSGLKDQYEVFRVRYQSLRKDYGFNKWEEIDERFRQKPQLGR